MGQMESFGQIFIDVAIPRLIPEVKDKNGEMSMEKQTRCMHKRFSLHTPYTEDSIRT